MRGPKPIAWFGALAFVLGFALTASAKNEIAGTYEIRTQDGCQGYLYVTKDLKVRRRIFKKDKSIWTQAGQGTLEGADLTVPFTGDGDPRNLVGTWTVAGDGYKGSAKFSYTEGKWQTSFTPKSTDADAEDMAAVTLSGAFDGLSFKADRNGEAVVYTLGADGFVLSNKEETLKRGYLPGKGGTTAKYHFEPSGEVTGSFPSCAVDKGVRISVRTTGSPSNDELMKLALSPDPVLTSLRAKADVTVQDTAKGSKQTKALKKGELVPVTGRDSGAWVVGSFKDGGVKPWKGNVKDDTLEPPFHYATSDKPIFLPNEHPGPHNLIQKDIATCYFDSALMAIAEHQPRVLETMFRELKDGTVAVRMYSKDKEGAFVEEWVRINKSIVVDDKGNPHYTTGEGGQLWPGLAEKAYAVFHGLGFFHNIEYGNSHYVFEAILGHSAQQTVFECYMPGELSAATIKAELPDLSKADVAALVAFSKGDFWKKESADLVDHPSHRHDPKYASGLVEKVEKLSENGRATLAAYYEAHCEAALGSGDYSTQAVNIYNLIVANQEAHRPMCIATRHWGTKGKGNAGENIELVAGIAGGHEYVCCGARTDENGIRWVKVINPWHHFSRLYKKDGKTFTASAIDGPKDTTKGEFEVELSDVMRYYHMLHHMASE
jgi:hypothetical protein